jgi:hypothetical protein
LVRGLFDSNYVIPLEYLWVVPLTGIISVTFVQSEAKASKMASNGTLLT